MEDRHFDVLIVGTGLTESITAAALSKAGFRVVHVDENSYYGGNEASLTLEELVQWLDVQTSTQSSRYTSVSRSTDIPSQSRQYSISLHPSVIPSVGPVVSSLVASGVSKYGGFRLLEYIGVYHPSGIVRHVPGTKEDVFKSKDIRLVDKRRLMRFLTFAAGDFEDKKELLDAHDTPFLEFLKSSFSLSDDIASAIVYCLAFCSSPSDPTLSALARVRRYLRSAGRYGTSPFLIGHYGGSGEIAQGFCRAAAVSGSVYILGRKLMSITRYPSFILDSDSPPGPRYSITLEDFPDTLTTRVIITSPAHVPSQLLTDINQLPSPSPPFPNASIARCIAIINRAIRFSHTTSPTTQASTEPGVGDYQNFDDSEVQAQSELLLDAGVIVFPPLTVVGGSATMAATVLVAGEGTMSTPKGKWILYIALPLPLQISNAASAQQLLQPYLDATLALSVPSNSSPTIPTPLFSTFYIEHSNHTLDVSPSLSYTTPLNTLNPSNLKTYIVLPDLSPAFPLPDMPDAAAMYAEVVFWEVVKTLQRDANNGQGTDRSIESFWPLLDVESEEEEE